MPAYHYKALTATGQEKKGVLEGDSARQVRQKLREMALIPVEVIQVGAKPSAKTPMVTSRKKVRVADLALATRQLATLLSAGLPVEEVLLGVAEETEKAHLKSVLLGVRSRVLEGYTLAAGMDSFPRAFPKLYRATVASGEKSGHLDNVLLRLADYLEKQHAMRSKIMQALIYPTLMTFVSIIIVIFLLTYVVPKMVNVFEQTKQTLPIATQMLLAISGFLKSYGLYVLGVIIIAIVIFIQALKRPNFKLKVHRSLLKLPVIGNNIKAVNTARFARTFGILFSATVPVLEAMQVAATLITPIPIRTAVDMAINKIREGASINRSLKETKYFPPMSIHLIASGEASGQLGEMLDRSAASQEQNVERIIENALTLFEPILILVMGGIVLFIVLAIMLPIFDLDQFSG